MDDVGSVSLSGTPLPELAAPATVLTKQPKQSEADEHAKQRLVDAEPLSYEVVPCTAIAQIDAQCQEASYHKRQGSCGIAHLLKPMKAAGQNADDKHHHVLQIVAGSMGKGMMPKGHIQ